MRWEELRNENCSIARSLSVLGDRWTLMVLRDCFVGIKRFDEFLAGLQLSRTVLTDRLNKLVEHNVLEKVPYQTRPTRYNYKLTSKGLALQPLILTMAEWGDTYYSENGEPPVIRTHHTCEKNFKSIMACSECGEPVTARNVSAYINPNCEREPGIRLPKRQ
ncbi:MAG: helix-turn-helix domain-containing protein [Sneathiella sp.]